MIKIENGVTRHPLWRMAEPINLEVFRGEQIAIVGDNAAGKSRLVEVLTGHYPLLLNEVQYDFSPSKLRLVSENLKYITFRDSYGDQDNTYYYQQRWNQHDIAEDTPTAGQLLQDFYQKADAGLGQYLLPEERELELGKRRALREKLTEMFRLDSLSSKYIISLSSGELRKFQMAKVLGTNPRVLILDNPFIGLDAPTRHDFRLLLETLTRETQLQIILILSKRDDIEEAMIGYCLGVEWWHKGIMTEAITETLAFLFRQTTVNRVEAYVEPENMPSHKLLEKLGFTKEGTLRQYERCRGELIDICVFGLLRKETKY